MDVTVQVALIGAMFTFFAGLVATIVNFFRERSEKEKWQRTLELEREKWQRTLELEREKWQRTSEMEERRIKHEENRWVLELNSKHELELHKMRLRTYPEIFAALEQLSHYHQDGLNENVVTELATKLNNWGYAEAGLCMLPDTREAVFALRRHLEKYLRKEISTEEVMHGPRTDLIELMRRDLNHNWSIWRQFKTLTDESLEGVQRTLADRK
jgi:hypothetical protein